MYYYVYITTNLINGKKYIGQHTSDNLNDGYLGSGKILKKAIDKYGKDSFSKEIICFAKDKEELNRLEIKTINEYNAAHDDMFYNITEGGEGTLGIKKSEESKRKASETKKRKFASGELKQPEWTKERRLHMSNLLKEQYEKGVRIRKGIKGEANKMYGRKGPLSPNYGKHMSEESKRKLSEKIKKQYKEGRTPGRKGKKDSPEILLQKSERMKKRIGSLNPNYGNKWTQKSKDKKAQTCKETKCFAGAKNPKAIPVICVETGIEYECISFAAKEYKCDKHYISQCCKNERETAGGVHWIYASHVNTVPSSQETA